MFAKIHRTNRPNPHVFGTPTEELSNAELKKRIERLSKWHVPAANQSVLEYKQELKRRGEDSEMAKYKVVFDNGKPYEESFKNQNDLKKALKRFYDENKDDDSPFDVKVYDEKENDITETQAIDEIVNEITSEDE